MTEKLREAALMALDALDSDDPTIQLRAAMNLRAALAEPAIKESLTVAEPVAWMCSDESLVHKGYSRFSKNCEGAWNIPVYTTPQPQRTWVGLTQAERHDIREWQKIQEELGPVWSPMMLYLYEAIEAKLKEKNG